MPDGYRIEKDSLGEMKVPEDALYGAQTQRAVENFPISGQLFGRRFIEALGLIKKSAAEINAELGTLDEKIAKSVAMAAAEVAEGKWDNQFIVDIYQTGSGTSTNMNMNEVVACRASELHGEKVHPNDSRELRPIFERCNSNGNPCVRKGVNRRRAPAGA